MTSATQKYEMPAGAEREPQYVVSAQAPSLATSTPGERSFAIGLCEVGDVSWCLYSLVFPFCAIGSARKELDGSSCFISCFNLNPVVLRWLTRSAYNIPGSCADDCMYGIFCPCCVINQAAQTAKQLGRPYPDVGPEFNRFPQSVMQNGECCNNCCYTTFCLPCALGTSLQASMGMPWIMGCMCTNFCMTRNLVRAHYRLQGNECGEDCCIPYGTCALAFCLSAWVPCAFCCTCPLFVGMVMNTLNEAKTRGNIDINAPNGTYLRPSTGTPPPTQYPILNTTATVASSQPPTYGAYVQQPAPGVVYSQPSVPTAYPQQAPANVMYAPGTTSIPATAPAAYELVPTASAPTKY